MNFLFHVVERRQTGKVEYWKSGDVWVSDIEEATHFEVEHFADAIVWEKRKNGMHELYFNHPVILDIEVGNHDAPTKVVAIGRRVRE
jgi:hypothetical protein